MLPTQTFLALLPLFLSLTLVCAAPQNAGSTSAASLRLARGSVASSTTSRTSTTSRAVTTTTRTTTASTRSTTSAPPASSSPPPATSGPSDAWSQGILAAHNSARNSHGAGNLLWAQDLVDAAKAWSDGCVWKHGGNSNIKGGAGQNLAAGASTATTVSQSGQAIVNAWMSEEKDYDPSNPTYSHFTQVVWKASSELGCYQSKCDAQTFRDGNGNLVFPNMKSVVFATCNYRKPGNVQGQYAANVQKNS